MHLKNKFLLGALSAAAICAQADGPKIIIHDEPKYESPYDTKAAKPEVRKTPVIVFNPVAQSTGGIQMSSIPPVYKDNTVSVADKKVEPAKIVVKAPEKKTEPVKSVIKAPEKKAEPVKSVAKTPEKKAEPVKSVIKEEVKTVQAKTVANEEIKSEPVKSVVKEEVKPVQAKTVAKEEIKSEPVKSVIKEEVKPVQAKTVSNEEIKSEPVKSVIKEEVNPEPMQIAVKEDVKSSTNENMLNTQALTPVASMFSGFDLFSLVDMNSLFNYAKYIGYSLVAILLLMIGFLFRKNILNKVLNIEFKKDPAYGDPWFRPPTK